MSTKEKFQVLDKQGYQLTKETSSVVYNIDENNKLDTGEPDITYNVYDDQGSSICDDKYNLAEVIDDAFAYYEETKN